ncbi:MAG: hypothetical protein ACOX00_07685 [Peptoniphilaceae bacterium]|jgi:ABC-type transport system involved in multi-copper enzyme maturation permease subunit
MITLIQHGLQERARRRELFVFIALGLLLLLFLGSGNAALSVNGEPITGFTMLFPVIMHVVNATLCILALVLSVHTIPEEYRRKTSHLIWVRGISQPAYHFSLALANFLAVALAGLILYGAVGLYLVKNGEGARLGALLLSFGMLSINTGIITSLTSVLSIVWPPLVAGLLSFFVLLAGILHPVLEWVSYWFDGWMASVLRAVLRITPDLDAIRSMATGLIQGTAPDWHGLFTALLWLYGISLLFFVLRKKEA